MALKIDIRPGQWITVGGIKIKLAKKSGQLASLVIDAPKDVPVEGPHLREVEKSEPMTVALP